MAKLSVSDNDNFSCGIQIYSIWAQLESPPNDDCLGCIRNCPSTSDIAYKY